MSNIIQTSDFPTGLKDALDKVFAREWETQKFQFEACYKVEDMDDAYVDSLAVEFPNEIDEAPEGSGFSRVTIDAAGTKRITAYTLRTELPITREAIEDLKYKPMKDGAKGLATALHRSIERRAARNLYNAFSSVQAMDDASVFNDSHSLSLAAAEGNTTTCDNRSQLSVNPANVKARRIALAKQLNERGNPIGAMSDQIIYGPDNMFTVKQFLKGEYEPGSANYDKNVGAEGLSGCMLTYIQESPFPNMWILRDSKMAGNRFYWRIRPEQWVDKEEKTGNFLYRVRCRIAIGWEDWRGVDGNTGEV